MTGAALEPPPDTSAGVAPAALRGDQIVVLTGATWADFQRLLEIRGDRPVPRISYLEGTIELMSPSRTHESVKSMIGRLLEAWCMEHGVAITPYGSWTLEEKAVERGVEPDECYVVGDDPDPARPHLAIEVVLSSGGIRKLEVYRKLAVREVWFWKQGRISVHELVGEQFEARPASVVLPGIDLEQLARHVAITPMTRAVQEYRDALRASRAG